MLVSPTAHRRIETAVAVPLPTSPSPASSIHDTPQARSNSNLSQPGSEASLRTRSPGLSPLPVATAAARHRAVSSSSYSSHGSGSASSARQQAASTPQRIHRAPSSTLDADLDDLSLDGIQDGDETADATQQPRFASNRNGGDGEDDTVQLTAPEDASMDLMGMNFNSPFKIPASAAAGGGGNARSAKTQSVLVERQNALAALETSTPQQQKTHRTVSTSSSSSNNSSTPSSAVRRSGLPRPVSMMHSPSPSGGGATGMQPFPRSASSRVLASTPSRQPQGRQVSQTSNGTSTSGSVLENRAKRLEATHTATPSPAKAKPEVWSWINTLSSTTADLRVFRRLARLSAEFKVPLTSVPGSDEEKEGDETVLRPGPLGNSATRASVGEGEEFSSDTEAWLDGGLFVSLFDGLKKYFILSSEGESGVGGELQLSAQVVLHRMVEYQFPLFGSTGKEKELVELLLGSISTLSSPATGAGGSSSSILAKKAMVQGHETILKSWSTNCDPVLGFDLLLSSSQPFLSSNTTNTNSTGVIAAILRAGLTPILLRLPSELLLEDFLPRLSSTLTAALKAQSTDLRLVATTMLKSINDKLKREGVDGSHDRIFSAIGLEGAEKSLLDVLMYYFSKK